MGRRSVPQHIFNGCGRGKARRSGNSVKFMSSRHGSTHSNVFSAGTSQNHPGLLVVGAWPFDTLHVFDMLQLFHILARGNFSFYFCTRQLHSNCSIYSIHLNAFYFQHVYIYIYMLVDIFFKHINIYDNSRG